MDNLKDQAHKKLEIAGVKFPSMDYEEHRIKGVGKHRYPVVNMDKFVDHSMDDKLHIEACKGLAMSTNFLVGGGFYGGLPPETREYYGGGDSFDTVLRNLEKLDPDGTHLQAIEDLIRSTSDVDLQRIYAGRYAYYALGAVIPWFYLIYLKKTTFFAKTNDVQSYWTQDQKNFPLITEYLNTLPFKTIGRVVFFTTFPTVPVPIHRDSIVAEHKDHNVNLFFSGSRKSFIFDPVTKEKIYLDQSAKSYFFNNRDFHGVDAEQTFRYTLRVDGTFTDELCEELGLEDGYTWKWDYERNLNNITMYK